MRMRRLLVIWNFAYADFLERVRRYSFLIVIAMTVIVGMAFVPSDNSRFGVMGFYEYRGIYNSAWVGCGVALLTSIFLSLVGFYLVKNTITRDEEIGVRQIIAITPTTKFEYCFGKVISNTILLSIIMLIMIVVAGIMQIIRGEVLKLVLPDLILPFIIITFPTILIISSLAVFFDSISWLRASIGNVLYFFIWISLVSTILLRQPNFDVLGGNIIISEIVSDIKQIYPGYNGSFTIFGSTEVNKVFYWNGIDWSISTIIKRCLWVVIAFLISVLSSVLLKPISKKYNKNRNISDYFINNEQIDVDRSVFNNKRNMTLEKLKPSDYKFNFMQLVMIEIKLMIRGYSWFWYVILSILLYLTISLRLENVTNYCLPLIYLWTIPLWSQIGSQEFKNKTEKLLYQARYYKIHQLFAKYLSTVILFLLIGSTTITRLIIHEKGAIVISFLIAALFISSLSLMLGILTKSSKLFEVIFTIIWYLGPIHKVFPFDFISFTGVNNILIYVFVYLFLSIAFLFIALFTRQASKIT